MNSRNVCHEAQAGMPADTKYALAITNVRPSAAIAPTMCSVRGAEPLTLETTTSTIRMTPNAMDQYSLAIMAPGC